ncbi:hypothetical protein HPB47_025487 [Ixodes persulcatus]|uniref:Uncharacterized protein n=1 Tax=Ixodes persulcatus TaxID=34615 RepID=A0AC60Q1D8_IXOPE|nr:hypothetical protein HPB47_025487 [Ixodes persulcatus]
MLRPAPPLPLWLGLVAGGALRPCSPNLEKPAGKASPQKTEAMDECGEVSTHASDQGDMEWQTIKRTFLVAYNEVKKGAQREKMSMLEYVRRSRDPSVNVVLLEDLAAVGGVAVAATCMGLAAHLGNPFYDALGSLLVGTLLSSVAAFIVYSNAAALVGRSIPFEAMQQINKELESDVMIRAIHDVKATDMGNFVVRYKAEIDIDGRELTRSYLDTQDLELLLEVRNRLPSRPHFPFSTSASIHDPEGCAFGKSPEKDEGKPPTREYGFALASGTRPHVATSHGLPELGLDRDAGNTWFPQNMTRSSKEVFEQFGQFRGGNPGTSYPTGFIVARRKSSEASACSGSGDKDRLLVFGTPKIFERLSTTRAWFMDGTFKVAPLLFHQVCAVHGLLYHGAVISLLYALLPNKKEETYRR